MVFLRYNSIENSYREKFIEFVRQTSAANDTWYVSSKLHGSNFVVSYCDEKITYGKRGGPLADNENFYNHKELFKNLEPQIIEAYATMEKSIARNSRITYYGEIFGPGVQKGVDYGVKGFRFFDVYIENSAFKGFLNQEGLPSYVIPNVLELVPQLGTGTLDEVLAWNCEFDSKILNKPNNPEEGIVMKPNVACFLEGSGDRIILKKKHPKFNEIAKAGEVKVVLGKLPEEIARYITKNRLDNVFSKTEKSFKNFSNILKEFVIDITIDCVKDNVEVGDIKVLEKECSTFIREELKKSV